MSTAPIRVMVVDDSAFMRLALRRIIEADGDLRVVGEAPDGAAALEQMTRLQPDVIAMDIEMPGLDGLEATRRIMAAPSPPAVVMVSHHTSEGSAMALAAMRAGATDWVSKETGLGGLDLGHLDRELRGRLRHWGAAHQARRAAAPPVPGAEPPPRGAAEIVVVGASTGGPDALGELLSAMGRPPLPVVVAQHMPAGMAPDLARALSRQSGIAVSVAADGLRLAEGQVVLIPGGEDGALVRRSDGFWLRLSARSSAAHPSVDVLFASAAIAARGGIAVVLTGMGQDGAQGAAGLARRGFALLAQSAASCVVPGMPGALLAVAPDAETGTPTELGRRINTLAAVPAPGP
ncbi:response regulator [Rhodovarius crocodyli]|uniref:protein-glutamate methylesterase n=1 Tax=Rhodovarius crocodyli TaxID=1979269 RepID=A0A437MNL7_9PROT|nr:chemotaxis protein CheB [Rhodovarius crocodyli]RVT99238.1 response regulator [Rhodovarius crocodyli]